MITPTEIHFPLIDDNMDMYFYLSILYTSLAK